MKNRFLLSTGLVIASILAFTTANAKDLRMAYDADPVTLDIHEQLSGGVLQLSHMSFDPLIRWTKELAFEPRLATSFQRLNPTTVRFTLRKGVKFHSGNTMTASDFKWTFKRLQESPDFKGIFANFAASTSLTTTPSTSSPPDLIHWCCTRRPISSRSTASFTLVPMPTATTRLRSSRTARLLLSTNLSGTGPFKVVSREQGVKVVFERFADYWGQWLQRQRRSHRIHTDQRRADPRSGTVVG